MKLHCSLSYPAIKFEITLSWVTVSKSGSTVLLTTCYVLTLSMHIPTFITKKVCAVSMFASVQFWLAVIIIVRAMSVMDLREKIRSTNSENKN